ncbi:MAG: sigma-70 family RNA polymerase sigma factor [Candidatus Eremiobacteraeota bacterium]|nr:sigma-70 family RNA polymerase sigma factor [Candidatus Eremiobacteraeota bacterium]MBV8365382.1 sigma-70 family RNA polymerase sigma factor [Candidatus Eremiobacteraeota bacterium]
MPGARPPGPATPPSPEQIAFVENAMTKFGKQTYNYAYRLSGNEADARDLTQEAFIRVFRAWQSFRPGTSFLSWIYRIVTNLYRDELRRRKGVFTQPLPEDNQPHEQAPRHDPISAMHERQLSAGMERALRALTDEQRSVILLADVEEYSYQQIADVLGCSIGTVRSRLHRARAQLRKLLLREHAAQGPQV